jgi:DNA modification methylase
MVLKDMKPNSVDFIFCDIPGVFDYQKKEIHQDRMSHKTLKNRTQEVLTEWNSSVTSVLLKAIQKLKNSKYAVLAIPRESFPNEIDSEAYSRSDFAMSSIITNSLEKMGLVLKAERIWFIPDDDTKKTRFRSIKGRFLIFRKENYFQGKINNDSIFFDKKIPTGNTYILHKSFPPSYNHKLRREHGGMKPPELTQILIEKYSTSSQDTILDPFAGVGGTLLGASLAGRKAIGIDINKRWKEIYDIVSSENNLIKQKFMIGDSRQVLEREIENDSVDLILTDVPYWAMDKLKKTRGRFSKAGEKSQGKLHSPLKKFNQSTILTIDEWLKLLEEIFSKCYKKLIAGKFLVVFIGNMYRTMPEYREDKTIKVGRYLLLTSMLAKMLLSIGFQFNNEIIWYSPDKALHVFGYPFSYIPSVVHQSILVFKK